MMTQHGDFDRMSATLRSIPDLTAWMTAWPAARAEFEALVAEYRARYPEADLRRLEWVLETTDNTLYELHHRLAWLEGQLRLGTPSGN